MKKLTAILLALVLVLSFAACGENTDPIVDAQQGGNNQQAGNDQNGSGEQGGQDQTTESGATQCTEPVVKEPTEPFSPYGTWVWVGNEKFTLTLNEDGSAVLNDQAENSYINLYPRLQALYMSESNTFTYDEANKRLTIHLKYEDREGDMECKISFGNGYYIIDGGETGYSFVRAEHFQAANKVFLDSPIYSRMSNLTPLEVGDTVDLFSDNEIKFTINNIEMDSDYNVKFHCTLSCKLGVSSLDWMKWELYVKGAGRERSDLVHFFDKSGQEIFALKDGQTVEGYFTIEGVDNEQSMAWFGELKAAVWISGWDGGVGAYIILPTQPT